MQIEEFLENSARRAGGKTALVAGARRLTYSEIDAQCNRLARALIAERVARWDRVIIFLENSVEAVISVFAISKAGAVFVVVNPTTKPDKLSFILNNCRATVVITDGEKLSSLGQCLREVPTLRIVLVAGDAATGLSLARPDARDGAAPPVSATDSAGDVPRIVRLEEVLADSETSSAPVVKKCIDVDLAALIYTSGSTGGPKGVMLSHLNIVSAATSITTYLENRETDIILNLLPLSFDYGLYQLLMAFKIGGTLILERSFTYPAKALDLIGREKVTGLPIVPTISSILLQMDLAKWDLSSLRYITNTAAALPSDHIVKLRKLIPHAKIYSMYGLTECKRVSYLPPEQIDIRPTSVGRGMPNEEVYIVDDEGNRVGPGSIGELVIRGSNVMKGYWEKPAETDAVLKPGPFPGEKVLYSGDLFKSDEEGYLYFVGRKDDIIKSRGEKVAPKEVEEVLYSLPGVAEAAVVGIPDATLGQAVVAIIVPQAGVRLTHAEVLRHCASHLEDFMVPKIVEFREEFPKTSSGKIAKRELVVETR